MRQQMHKTLLRHGWAVHSGNVVDLPARPAPVPVIDGLVEAGLDAIGQGVAILAADGSLIHANAALRAFVARRDGLALDERGLVSADGSAQSRLRDAVWVALSAAVGTVRVLPHATQIAVPRAKGGAPWLIEVRPLGSGKATGVMLVVAEPPGRLPGAAELGRVLGLDKTEVALALALAAGDSQAALARRRGISPRGLRRQIGRLRDCTGCRSTAELIGLVLSLRV
jgi:DNA-binding CsgD family transcriptional regulator